MPDIPYIDLRAVNDAYGDAMREASERVLSSGWYLQGEENRRFEDSYALFTGTRHAVGCANGLDALRLIFRALKALGRIAEGDEVIVPANTFIASFLAITEEGLVPHPVEPTPSTMQIDAARIEEAIGPRTRAILIVHLYGRCAFSGEIAGICRSHGLILVEDNAQAHGCIVPGDGRRTGSLGDAAAHSFYPGKNLGALGDGGAVTTSDSDIADTVRTLANYGSSRKYVFPLRGINSRLDELQAAFLSAKLQRLDADNAVRREIAAQYFAGIHNPAVTLPDEPFEPMSNVWHIFPVLAMNRDSLREHLGRLGIHTIVHYPIPPHRQQCYADEPWAAGSFPVTDMFAASELSLPISPVQPPEATCAVIDAVNSWKPDS